MTKSEEIFVDQMTRKLLVDWCTEYITRGALPSDVHINNVFVAHAIEKGWISISLLKILSKGWTTAASFLRR